MSQNGRKMAKMLHNAAKSLTAIAPSYGDLTLLGIAELEEAKSLRILRVTLDKLTFETHLREVVSKVARSLGVVCRARKFSDCPCVLKNRLNAYVLSSLEYCEPVWISPAEFHLSLLDSIVRSADML